MRTSLSSEDGCTSARARLCNARTPSSAPTLSNTRRARGGLFESRRAVQTARASLSHRALCDVSRNVREGPLHVRASFNDSAMARFDIRPEQILPEILRLVSELPGTEFNMDRIPLDPSPVFRRLTWVSAGRLCICSAMTAAPIGPIEGFDDKSRLVNAPADLLWHSIFERTAVDTPKLTLLDRQS